MSSYLFLSMEFVCLLDWLLKNKRAEVRKLVGDAVNSGCVFGVSSPVRTSGSDVARRVHGVVSAFISFLEDSLTEEFGHEGQRASDVYKRLAASIGKFDSNAFDPGTLWLSLQQAKFSILMDKTNASGQMLTDRHAREILLKNLLRNWVSRGEEVKS